MAGIMISSIFLVFNSLRHTVKTIFRFLSTYRCHCHFTNTPVYKTGLPRFLNISMIATRHAKT